VAFALDEASQQRIKQVRDFLHDYTRLRYTVLGTLAAIAFALWWTLGGDIDKLRAKVAVEKERQAFIEDLKTIKKFMDGLGPLVPDEKTHDLPWWMDQFTVAARESGVQLDQCVPRPTGTSLGQYPLCIFQLEAVGSYQGLVRFVDRVENIRPLALFDRVEVEELTGEKLRALTVDLLPGERKATVVITVLMSPKDA
jgi:hypothetical protein